MPGWELTKTKIQGGLWEGELRRTGETATEQPDLSVTHLETPLEGVEIRALEDDPAGWEVRIPIPPETLADGVQTFLVSDRPTGLRLASFTIVTGQPLEEDIRAEVDLLRAELDMLKRAFRRHCVETM